MIETQPIQMVDLKGQYLNIKSEVDKAIADVINTTMFVGGPAVSTFAKSLQDYLDCRITIPCGNGTDALQIALMALNLEPGDEVITTPFTFVATAEVIALLGLKPVFVDVHADSFLIDEHKIEAAISDRTKVIIPVHLFGQGANMEAIMELANKHDIAVIEDNAQAIGADYIFSDGRKQKLGTIGHIGCTSFFPSKNLGCYGDGGAIFTNDADLGDRIKMIVNHGMKVRYYHDEVGVNSRLDGIQAAVLNVKLKYLDDYGKARIKAADFYDKLFENIPGVTVPKRVSFSNHVFHQYTVLIDENRDEIAAGLAEKKIAHGVYYPVPLHIQKAYKHYGYEDGDFEISEMLAKKVLSLPMHTELTEEIQSFIVDNVKRLL